MLPRWLISSNGLKLKLQRVTMILRQDRKEIVIIQDSPQYFKDWCKVECDDPILVNVYCGYRVMCNVSQTFKEAMSC